MSDVENVINNLELDYALHKEKFEEWKRANEQLAGYASYNRYVERFHDWEKGVFEQLRELKAIVTQSSATKTGHPQLPMVNLDSQLNECLTNISQAEFTLAFFAMAQKDVSFMQKVFEVVHRESKGTGYTNRIFSKTTPNTSYSVPTVSPVNTSLNASYNSNILTMPSHTFSTPPPGYMPNIHQPPPNIHVQHPVGSHLQQPYYTQSTQYGAIPDGWTVDEAIRKRPKLPSPSRDYRKGPNLPFKDFSQ